jgi:hypothetical protein
MPGEGIGSMLDSKEEIFSGVEAFQQSAAEKQEKDAVKSAGQQCCIGG